MSSAGPPKYQDVSRRLESEIATGRWQGGRIPGLREIAAEYGVSVVTASKALHVLRDKGLVHSVHRSGNYLVEDSTRSGLAVPSGQALVRRWALCIRTTPGPWQRASSSVTTEGFAAVEEELNHGFATDLFPFGDDTTLEEIRRQARQAVEAGISGLFLLPSRLSDAGMQREEWLLDACRELGLPAVLIERDLRGDVRPLRWDLVGTDDLEGGYRCARHLLDQGRQRVAIVVASPTSTHNDRLAGYLLALHKAGSKTAPLILEHRVDLPSKDAHRLLVEELVEHRADGVCCYQDTVAMAIILEMLARRVRIPEDLAIVGYDDLAIGSSFSIGLTTFALDATRIALEAVRVMEQRLKDPTASPIKVAVPGRLILRESSAPAT